MNDPNKAINVNISSLLSLKAELIRKQAEVQQAKTTRTNSEEYQSVFSAAAEENNSLGQRKNKKQRNKDATKKIAEDATAKIYEYEDSALLDKSKRILEAKSKFYERMTQSGGKLNSDDNCLVLFNRKKQEESHTSIDQHVSDISSSSDSENDTTFDDNDDWVEFTDCLGRTRKCLREDLESAKKRDDDLAASMPERLDQNKPNWLIDNKHNDDNDEEQIGPLPTESIYSDGCSFMSKHDEQRANWERKEQENVEKKNIHYQDVFFDEARQHGVGYYAFSTDDEERKRQQHAFDKVRSRTMEEQTRRETLKTQREKIIAERVLAAKNRQRARQGLPPLEKEETTESKKVLETKEERRIRKRAEKLKRKQEKLEKERELERKQHIRPWDKDKSAINKTSSQSDTDSSEEEWKYKAERLPLSQEQWNERKREERIKEFAPMPEEPKRTNFTCMPPPPPPPIAPSYSNNDINQTTDFRNFQSTKCHQKFQRRNYEGNKNNDDDDDEVIKRHGANIPPPDSLLNNFTLPPSAKRARNTAELERSVEKGLKFLRDGSDKDVHATKSSWTAKADY